MPEVMPTRRHSWLSVLATSIMRLIFHLLYHSLAWTYDLVAATVSVGRWRRWVLTAAELVNGPQVLEMGYGPGHLQVHLTAAGLVVVGLDESLQMARQANRRLVRLKLPSRVVRGLAQNIPYRSDFFDSVVATFPTRYISDPATLAEIQRVLRPGGQLVVLMAGWITGKSLPDRIMDFIIRFTGQAPAPDQELVAFTEPYSEAGFQVSLRFIELDNSRIMYILARK